VAVAVLVLANLPELARIMRFAGFQAFDPGTDGLGNLAHPLSPLEALGIWPTSDFRVSPADAGAPALLFYLGAALGAAVVAIGIRRAWMERSSGVLGALGCAVAIYVGSAATVTAYASAKALAVCAPILMLVALRPFTGSGREAGRSGVVTSALTVLFVCAALLSSMIVLRQAAVGPDDHRDELGELRPLLEGEDVLFLGRDNFVLYGLRGSRPFTHVLNYYDPYFVRPNPRLRDAGLKFDFDSVSPKTLGGFPYVITSRAAYASGPPPAFEPIRETESYVLWERRGAVGPRRTLAEGAQPGAILRCNSRRQGVASVMSPVPVETGVGDGMELNLSPGRWKLSLQYDATRPVRVQAPGLDVTLPANLDFRGPGPYWPAGTMTVDERGPVEVATTVADPPLLGRLLGAESAAHVGAIAATPAAGTRRIPLERACGEYVDWYSPGR
jgi:hypothetical protein